MLKIILIKTTSKIQNTHLQKKEYCQRSTQTDTSIEESVQIKELNESLDEINEEYTKLLNTNINLKSEINRLKMKLEHVYDMKNDL
jgi:flagellar motor switch/type III secretory pathway protein FliN